MRLYRLSLMFGIVAMAAILGCIANPDHTPSRAADATVDAKIPVKEEPKPAGETKKVKVGKNIELEVRPDKSKRVLIQSEVCFREGPLEQLLTCKRIKAHEAILTADIDARQLHFALTLAGAEAGKVVQFRPKLMPPTGTPIKITLEFKAKDKTVRVSAREWIRNMKTKKDFPSDWVFAGSVFIPDPTDNKKPPFYGANDGDVISVVNFEGACLDVPFLSTKDNADLDFEAHTERIPALKTPVTLILEPILPKKQ
jgi:hypothetical protein